MKGKVVFKALFLALALVLLENLASHACSCSTMRAPQAELESASAVFSGKVTGIKYFEKELRNVNRIFVMQIMIVTLQPLRIWKGDLAPEMEVETRDPEFDNCGVDFKKGQDYLVYAVNKQRLETDVCSRTRLLSQASEDLRDLGEGRQP